MDRPLSKVVDELPTRFFKRFEIECSDETKFQVIGNIKENAVKKYENVNTIDGVKIVFPDSWALIRASNTSPILRLSVEAKDQKRLSMLESEMKKLIKDYGINCS
jgi:phosphomannomutase/phosphoglucomutase